MNYENCLFIFGDRDLCTENLLKEFDKLPFKQKVCFTAKKYPHINSCIQIKEFKNEPHIGDLYFHFSLCKKYFDIANWLSGGDGKRKKITQSAFSKTERGDNLKIFD